MNYVRYFLAIFLLCIILTGCTEKNPNGSTVLFYYRSTESNFGSETGLFAVEERTIHYSSSEYEKLIEEYLNGAKSSNCTSPFPGGTTLTYFSLHDGNATIVFSPHMVFQSQADVTTCCACLCQTLFNLPDIQTITISVDGEKINGANELVFQKDSFLIRDDVSSNTIPRP